MDYWKNNALLLEGEFDSETWKWIEFTVSKCVNTTDSKHCASEDVI